MNAVEAYIHFTPGLIDDTGTVTVKETEDFLRNFMHEFHQFIIRVKIALPDNA
jgi:chromate reductase